MLKECSSHSPLLLLAHRNIAVDKGTIEEDHVISKLIGQKYFYHSWKELVEISKNVNFQKSKFYMKTFGNLRW